MSPSVLHMPFEQLVELLWDDAKTFFFWNNGQGTVLTQFVAPTASFLAPDWIESTLYAKMRKLSTIAEWIGEWWPCLFQISPMQRTVQLNKVYS